jgi:hypothetical protein
MKKVSIILIALFFTIALNGFSQTPNYFEGKWAVLIKGTPDGDVVVPMRFETKDGKTMGFLTEKDAKVETMMTSAEVKGEELLMAFTISGYDVTLTITKKDDENASGKLMDMFEVEAKKVK